MISNVWIGIVTINHTPTPSISQKISHICYNSYSCDNPLCFRHLLWLNYVLLSYMPHSTEGGLCVPYWVSIWHCAGYMVSPYEIPLRKFTNKWMDGWWMNEWMNEYIGFWNLVQFYLVTIPCCDSIDEAPKSPTNNHVGGSELILSATRISNGNKIFKISTQEKYVLLCNILLTFQTHFSLHKVNRR